MGFDIDPSSKILGSLRLVGLNPVVEFYRPSQNWVGWIGYHYGESLIKGAEVISLAFDDGVWYALYWTTDNRIVIRAYQVVNNRIKEIHREGIVVRPSREVDDYGGGAYVGNKVFIVTYLSGNDTVIEYIDINGTIRDIDIVKI